MRPVWFILGLVAFGIGFIGAFLPLLPTVPLMLLAAFCFAKSSPSMHNWIVNHPNFGPAIADWHERGAISRRAKSLATISVGMAFLLSMLIGVPWKWLIVQGLVLCGVMGFIWSRPD